MLMTLAAGLLSFVLLGFDQVGRSHPPCLKYESAATTLSGTIKRVTFPGPPNYASTARGDLPEVAWALTLSAPVCVTGDGMNEAESNVTDVQLVLAGGAADFKRYRALVGRGVRVTGKLFHAHTAHHHTAVLMEVSGIRRTGR